MVMHLLRKSAGFTQVILCGVALEQALLGTLAQLKASCFLQLCTWCMASCAKFISFSSSS